MSTTTGPPEPPPDLPLTPGEALAKLFMDNADRGANHENDELVAALRQRAQEIQALAELTRYAGSTQEDEGLTGISDSGDDPELTAAMRQAETCGFHFTRPSPGAAWQGQRQSAQWRDVVFLDPSGPCNACRSRTEGFLVAERICGTAQTVLRTVCNWPI